MGMIEIDTGNPDLFKPMEFKVCSKGKHLFEVANDLVVEPSKSSDNNLISAQLKCLDDGDDKGATVFDRFVLMADTTTEKGRKAQQINQGRLCQFAVACGILTQEEIKNGSGIPLDKFKGSTCEAITKVCLNTDPNTDEQKQRAEIVKYIFED